MSCQEGAEFDIRNELSAERQRCFRKPPLRGKPVGHQFAQLGQYRHFLGPRSSPPGPGALFFRQSAGLRPVEEE